MTAVFDGQAIAELLPHGAAMRLIDRVEVTAGGLSARATRTIQPTEWCFHDSSADRSYPTALVVESFGQAAAVLWFASRGGSADPESLPMFVSARKCSFFGNAPAGSTLDHLLTLEHSSEASATVSGHTSVDGQVIAAFSSLMAITRPRTDLGGSNPARPSHS